MSASGAWGVIGGTFDPIHFAHLAVAEQTRETLGLRGILFVPAGVPPHKPGRPISPAEDRVAMVSLAIADNPAFVLCLLEVERPGPSYTVDTVEALLAAPPEPARGAAEFIVIVSAEAVAGLPEWHEPERLLDSCRMAIVPRRGYATPDGAWLTRWFPGREGRFLFLDGPDLGHSASAIRTRVAESRSIRYLVPPSVERYVLEHGLYRGGPWADPMARPAQSTPGG